MGTENKKETYIIFGYRVSVCLTICFILVSFASPGASKANKQLLSTGYVLNTSVMVASYASAGCNCIVDKMPAS